MPGGLQQHELPSHVIQDARPVKPSPAAANDEIEEEQDGDASDDAVDAGSSDVGKHEHESTLDACVDADACEIGGYVGPRKHDAVEINQTR